MPGEDASREGPRTPPEAQRLSTSRLLLVVVLFFALAAYSIWNSDRFQTLLQDLMESMQSGIGALPKEHFEELRKRLLAEVQNLEATTNSPFPR